MFSNIDDTNSGEITERVDFQILLVELSFFTRFFRKFYCKMVRSVGPMGVSVRLYNGNAVS